jgi:OFA family oxalate/formate antiporter-like MFS transporter
MNRWRVVVGGVLMNLALGSLYAWSVFLAPLEREFGWKRTQTSLAYTIAIVTFAATFLIAGRLQDKRGPRICAFIGTVCVSLGFFLTSMATSLIFLYIAFGLVVGAGNGFGYATPIPVASKWFPDKRGLVVGIMVGGYGAASFILGLFVPGMIASIGWRPTFQILGAAFLMMGLMGTWLMTNPPQGYRPAGWIPPAAAAARRDFTTPEMLRMTAVLPAVGGVLPRHDGRTDDDQPARAIRDQRRWCRIGGVARGRLRKCRWPNPIRMAVGRGWTFDHP